MRWQREGGLRSGAVAAAAIVCVALCGAFPAAGQGLLYWDTNGDIPGAGGPSPSGTWDATATNWSPAEAGDVATGAWVSGTAAGFGDTAVFSAGSDATGSFTVTLGGTNNAAGMVVKTGTVIIGGTAGVVALGSGTVTVMPGATLGVSSAARVSQTAGGLLVLDGSTLQSITPSASSIWTASGEGILLTANGGTISHSASAVGIFQGRILGEGGTVDNGGAQTLTKTGTSELRVQTAATGSFTFQKLVVKEGLYRLGSITTGTPAVQQTQETGFGALPQGPLEDAITLDGGAIGTSFNLQTDPFRGITVGPGGGVLNTTSGVLTVAAPMKSVRSRKLKRNASANKKKNKRPLRPVAMPHKPPPTRQRVPPRVAAKKPHLRPTRLSPLFLVPLARRMPAKPLSVKKVKPVTCCLNWVVG